MGGMPLALASNSEREFVERTLAGAGLFPDGPFAAIVSANEIEHPKPAPDIYLEACRQLGVDPREAIALEDSPIGVAAAAAAGMFVIAVPYFTGTPIVGASMQADSLGDRSVARALGLSPLPDPAPRTKTDESAERPSRSSATGSHPAA